MPAIAAANKTISNDFFTLYLLARERRAPAAGSNISRAPWPSVSHAKPIIQREHFCCLQVITVDNEYLPYIRDTILSRWLVAVLIGFNMLERSKYRIDDDRRNE